MISSLVWPLAPQREGLFFSSFETWGSVQGFSPLTFEDHLCNRLRVAVSDEKRSVGGRSMQLRPLLALSFTLLGISAVACFAALSGAGAEKPTSVAAVDRQHPGSSVSDLRKKITSLIPGLLLVILSASSEVVDKVLLLEMGADDYVTIPFSPSVARLRGPISCVARRSGQLVCFEASCL